MNNDLISREALKKEIASLVVNGESRIYEVMPRCGGEWIDGIASAYREIDNAPTVELDESVIQEVLNKRCMTVVTNEYLIALHGKRSPGKWIKKVDDAGFVSYICSECGAEIEVEDTKDDKFCFNCGAKMQKGGSNG